MITSAKQLESVKKKIDKLSEELDELKTEVNQWKVLKKSLVKKKK